MENFFFQLHSGVRWLVVLATIIALLKLIVGLVQNATYDQLTHRIMIAFSGLITVQWVLGLILFIILGGFDIRTRWEHAIILTVAVGLSHMHMRWKESEDRIRYRNALLIVIAVLVLVFIGVQRVNGWNL